MCLEAATIAELISEEAASFSTRMPALFAIPDASGLEVTTITFDGKIAAAPEHVFLLDHLTRLHIDRTHVSI